MKINDISITDRQQRAEELFLEGYNCCQAVVLAFDDLLPVGRDELLALTSGFGGGMGRMREVCGAVSGMTILAGFISPGSDPSDKAAKTANYTLVQRFAASFREQKGSIICRELLGLRAEEKSAPEPSDRNPAYYHTRPCQANVGLAARIVAEYLKSLS